MATPRSNSACTAGLHEVGKLTFPSLSSCCADAPMDDVAIRAAIRTRRLDCMMRSRMAECCQARASRDERRPQTRRSDESRMPADGIGAAPCDGGDFGMSRSMAAHGKLKQLAWSGMLWLCAQNVKLKAMRLARKPDA